MTHLPAREGVGAAPRVPTWTRPPSPRPRRRRKDGSWGLLVSVDNAVHALRPDRAVGRLTLRIRERDVSGCMTCSTWVRFVAVCFVLAGLFLPSSGRVDAAQPAWLQTTRTAHGVRLTLSIRDRPYPRNALVRVWARVQNLTSHDIFMYDDGPMAAGKYIPQAVVRARPGGPPLPISLTDYMPYPGPAPMGLPLHAGATLNIPEIIILRGPVVQLRLTLTNQTKLAGEAQPAATMSTPVLRARLTALAPPHVLLDTSPTAPSLRLTPPAGAHGNPLAVWNMVCASGFPGGHPQEMIDWTPVSTDITPTCSPLTGWHEIVGWLGHSVAQIDWGAEQD
jgi:hypothetical protein